MDVREKLVELLAPTSLDYEKAVYLADYLAKNGVTIGKPLAEHLHPIDSYKGLKGKYLVFKAETGEKVEDCFVLRPEKDRAAVTAIRAYAEATDNSTLADDLIQWVGKEPPLTLDELRKMDREPVWCVDGSGNEVFGLVNTEMEDFPDVIDNESGLWRGCFYNMSGDGTNGLHKIGWLAYRHKMKEDPNG